MKSSVRVVCIGPLVTPTWNSLCWCSLSITLVYPGPSPQYNMSQPPYLGYPPQPASGGYASNWDQSAVLPSQQTSQGGAIINRDRVILKMAMEGIRHNLNLDMTNHHHMISNRGMLLLLPMGIYGAPQAQKPLANPPVYGQPTQSPGGTPRGYGQLAPVQPGYPHSQSPAASYAQLDYGLQRAPPSNYGAAAGQPGYAKREHQL
uniref:Uncharacterized protein n=1 Tax=Quercus lobata TaxID=97700 RepID=A0A7N2N0K3_QUELO